MNSLPVLLTKKQRNSGWLWWAFQLLLLPLLLNEGNRFLAAPLSEAKLNFVFFCLNFAGITLILWSFLRISCGQGLRHIFRTLQSGFFGLVLYFLASAVLNFVIGRFFPDYVNLNDGSLSVLIQQEPVLLRVAIVFLVPVAEELLYRGVIFGSIHSKSRFLAYALSAGLFSLVHFVGFFPDPLTFVISFVLYLPAGLCLAWAYQRSGSILAPILMHIAINQMGLQLLR